MTQEVHRPQPPDVPTAHRTPFGDESIRESVLEVLDEPRSINTQLFENSELADDPVVEAERNDPDRLFQTEKSINVHNRPNLAILGEKPEHRVIVYLKAQGLSNKEVAEKTGFTYPWVSQITRQPWFRLRLVQELKEAGQDQITTVLRSTALDSVFTIVDIRDDPTAPKAVRRQAADSLLDRFLGKPTQRIESEERTPSTAELSAVDEQLREIDKQLAAAPASEAS
jgi:hypothetical protein